MKDAPTTVPEEAESGMFKAPRISLFESQDETSAKSQGRLSSHGKRKGPSSQRAKRQRTEPISVHDDKSD